MNRDLHRTARPPRTAAASVGTILVVDGDDSMRELLRAQLANAGYEVLLAEDAVLAGRHVLRSAPDLMVIDTDIPLLNGIDFVAALRADPTTPFFPVLFMTRNLAHRARLEKDRIDYLAKPFYVNIFLDKVMDIVPPHFGRHYPRSALVH